MATFTLSVGDLAAHDKTLTASTVDTVTFAGLQSYVDIITDGAAAIYVTADGSTPTVSGANTLKLPAITGVQRVHVGPSPAVLKLISSGTPVYSVVAAYEKGA